MSGANAWAAELILVAAPWKASAYYPAGTCVLSAIDIPSWTTATRPTVLLNVGRLGFNTTTGLLEQWNGSAWQSYDTANLSSPPPIGNTTPNSGAFTTLSASSTVSGAGFTAWAASPPAIGGTAPAAGSFTTLSASGTASLAALSASGTITPSQTNGIVGTTTNNDANAGSVGEFISAEIASGSATAIGTGVAGNITNLASLGAGDWDVWGNVGVSFSGTAGSSAFGWISTTSGTLPTDRSNGGAMATINLSNSSLSAVVMPVGMTRIKLSAPANVFLSVFATFTGTATAFGFIGARRRR
jgi:hypothetical protein